MTTLSEPAAIIERLHNHMSNRGMIRGRTVNRRMFDGLTRRFHVDLGYTLGEVRIRVYEGSDHLLDSFNITKNHQVAEAVSWLDLQIDAFLQKVGVLGVPDSTDGAVAIEDVPG